MENGPGLSRCISNIEDGEIPASHVCLLEGIKAFLLNVFFFTSLVLELSQDITKTVLPRCSGARWEDLKISIMEDIPDMVPSWMSQEVSKWLGSVGYFTNL